MSDRGVAKVLVMVCLVVGTWLVLDAKFLMHAERMAWYSEASSVIEELESEAVSEEVVNRRVGPREESLRSLMFKKVVERERFGWLGFGLVGFGLFGVFKLRIFGWGGIHRPEKGVSFGVERE